MALQGQLYRLPGRRLLNGDLIPRQGLRLQDHHVPHDVPQLPLTPLLRYPSEYLLDADLLHDVADAVPQADVRVQRPVEQAVEDRVDVRRGAAHVDRDEVDVPLRGVGVEHPADRGLAGHYLPLDHLHEPVVPRGVDDHVLHVGVVYALPGGPKVLPLDDGPDVIDMLDRVFLLSHDRLYLVPELHVPGVDDRQLVHGPETGIDVGGGHEARHPQDLIHGSPVDPAREEEDVGPQAPHALDHLVVRASVVLREDVQQQGSGSEGGPLGALGGDHANQTGNHHVEPPARAARTENTSTLSVVPSQ